MVARRLGPLIESRSRREPFGMVKSPQFDYRFHERSYNFTKVMQTGSDDTEQVVEGFDIKKMFTEVTSFVDSRSDILMQAVDVLTSYSRRSLRAPSVDDETLRQIGRLQIYRKRGDALQSIGLLSLGPVNHESIVKGSVLARRIRIMTKSARNLWVPQKKSRRTKTA
jgi:hypothetical protein